jgi:cytochrome P450
MSNVVFLDLEAVIRESMRMHPSVAMPLERYVPETGATLPDGSFVPPSTIVGMTPYVVSRNRDIWGADADEFRPERWLQAEGESGAAYQERLQSLNANDLTFGGGSRICLGRHLALVELYKIVATFARRYEMELADPNREWQVRGVWFFRQNGLICKMKKRS